MSFLTSCTSFANLSHILYPKAFCSCMYLCRPIFLIVGLKYSMEKKWSTLSPLFYVVYEHDCAIVRNFRKKVESRWRNEISRLEDVSYSLSWFQCDINLSWYQILCSYWSYPIYISLSLVIEVHLFQVLTLVSNISPSTVAGGISTWFYEYTMYNN